MSYLSRLFRPFRREETSPFVDEKTTIKLVHKWLIENGWTLLPLNDLLVTASLLARKGPTTLAIKCTGSNRPLLAPFVGDLRRMVVPKGFHPIFIYGEQKDPRIWNYIRPNDDVILPIDDIDDLPAEVDALNPTLVSAIDAIQAPNIIRGWTRISPRGQVMISAYSGGQVIGTCETNVELTRPDGTFRFALKINEEMPLQKIPERVYVKASMGEGRTWSIPIIDNVRLLPAA